MNTNNSERNEVLRLRTESRKITQKCYSPGCSNDAIRSHIQQQNGPLKEIAANGQIVQLDLARNGGYRFVQHGIGGGDVLTFWGFCSSCDRKIFKSIETKDVDYRSYKTQLLFAYRGLLNELYKQEYNIKLYSLIFKSQKITKGTKQQFREKEQLFLLMIEDNKELKKLIESELSRVKSFFRFLFPKKLKFFYFKLPRFEIVTSAISSISYVDNKERRQTTFLSLMPKATHLHVLIGEYNDGLRYNLPPFKTMDDSGKMKYISDLIIVTLETWCISTTLYKGWQATGKDNAILSEIHKFRNKSYKREWRQQIKQVDINLFE